MATSENTKYQNKNSFNYVTNGRAHEWTSRQCKGNMCCKPESNEIIGIQLSSDLFTFKRIRATTSTVKLYFQFLSFKLLQKERSLQRQAMRQLGRQSRHMVIIGWWTATTSTNRIDYWIVSGIRVGEPEGACLMVTFWCSAESTSDA